MEEVVHRRMVEKTVTVMVAAGEREQTVDVQVPLP
jgi:hypothetical protein